MVICIRKKLIGITTTARFGDRAFLQFFGRSLNQNQNVMLARTN